MGNHESAVIENNVHVGENTKIWHFSHIMEGVRIGNNCILGQNVFVGKNVSIGNGCKIQNNVSIYEGVTLDDFVFVGPSAVFTNVRRPRASIERKDQFESTLVGTGATLGANTTIMCGVKIGQYAFVAAGAVVTHNVPSFAVVAGNPASFKEWVCRCGHRILFHGTGGKCVNCGKRFKMMTPQTILERE